MERGASRISPFGVAEILPSAAANKISALLDCRGEVVTISNSCPAGLDAIGCAFQRISYARDNIFLAGGMDAQITPFGLALLCASRIMSERNDDPEGASRPFDKTRDGGILSEGAGILVIEEMEHALNRGAHIYAEILGYASRTDGSGHNGSENPVSGIERTMRIALQDAGIRPEEVGYISAHAPSDDFDAIETAAIKNVFGEHAYNLPVSSIKSMIGNPLAAAGPLQLIASVMVFEKNIIPPTINYERPDPDCDLDYVPEKARRCDGVRIVLMNSHGFGGINSSLVIGKYT
jgi:3-oxoacyl-[acyl-carrier-protein] synthase II